MQKTYPVFILLITLTFFTQHLLTAASKPHTATQNRIQIENNIETELTVTKHGIGYSIPFKIPAKHYYRTNIKKDEMLEFSIEKMLGLSFFIYPSTYKICDLDSITEPLVLCMTDTRNIVLIQDNNIITPILKTQTIYTT